MSKLERIKTFITVVEEQGFGLAAKKLHLTAAAVSKQVQGLEDQLGITLLQRSTRHLELTPLGQQYFLEVKKALGQLDAAEALINQATAEPTGLLRVTAARYFGVNFILPYLSEFLQSYPKIRLDLELAERFPDLMREEIDLLIGVSRDESAPELVRRRILSTRYIFCASPGYLKKFGMPAKPEDLKQHRYITHTIRNEINYVNFQSYGNVYLEPYLYLNDTRAMRECALQGLGIVKLHDYSIKKDIESGKLIEILKKYSIEELPVYLFYRSSRHLDPKIRVFIDFYLNKIEQFSSKEKS